VLPGHILRWHKRSNKDGSGKCSIEKQEDGSGIVRGAIFSVPDKQMIELDRVEGLGFGYQQCLIEVETSTGPEECITYLAEETHIDDELRPFSWYRDLVVAGAEAVGLHGDYLESLRQVTAIQDPDPDRDAGERSFIPFCGCCE
jgi:hypothetical protein